MLHFASNVNTTRRFRNTYLVSDDMQQEMQKLIEVSNQDGHNSTMYLAMENVSPLNGKENDTIAIWFHTGDGSTIVVRIPCGKKYKHQVYSQWGNLKRTREDILRFQSFPTNWSDKPSKNVIAKGKPENQVLIEKFVNFPKGCPFDKQMI